MFHVIQQFIVMGTLFSRYSIQKSSDVIINRHFCSKSAAFNDLPQFPMYTTEWQSKCSWTIRLGKYTLETQFKHINFTLLVVHNCSTQHANALRCLFADVVDLFVSWKTFASYINEIKLENAGWKEKRAITRICIKGAYTCHYPNISDKKIQ